ncbi:MAG: histone deacetylase family protein, partial [Thermoanaerobaculia bacterium]
FRPEVVLVTSGFDAHEADPVGGMRVSTEGFSWMSRALEDVAEAFAGGRIVSLLEGGYHPEATAAAAVQHVRVLSRADEMI